MLEILLTKQQAVLQVYLEDGRSVLICKTDAGENYDLTIGTPETRIRALIALRLVADKQTLY